MSLRCRPCCTFLFKNYKFHWKFKLLSQSLSTKTHVPKCPPSPKTKFPKPRGRYSFGLQTPKLGTASSGCTSFCFPQQQQSSQNCILFLANPSSQKHHQHLKNLNYFKLLAMQVKSYQLFQGSNSSLMLRTCEHCLWSPDVLAPPAAPQCPPCPRELFLGPQTLPPQCLS